MNQKKFNQLMNGYFHSEEGEKTISTIVMRSLATELIRDVELENGTENPGKTIVEKKKVNLLDFLAYYIPRLEGALRGCQSDSAKSRNRSNEVKEMITDITEGLRQRGLDLLTNNTKLISLTPIESKGEDQ